VTIVRNSTRSGPLGWKLKAARAGLEAAVERLEEGADALLVRLPTGIVAEEPVEEIEAQGSVEDAGAERKAEANVRAHEQVGGVVRELIRRLQQHLRRNVHAV
jgi:hypothetical protein